MQIHQKTSSQVKKSILFKGLALILSYITIPITLKYLGTSNFGVWSTILTIISWVSFFDIGITNSLRTEYAKLRGDENNIEIKKLLSSAYTLMGLITVLILITFSMLTWMTNWQKLLNTTLISELEIRLSLIVSISCICTTFWLNSINSIYNAEHRTEVPILGQLVTNAIIFILVYVIAKSTPPSLVKISTCYGLGLVLSSLLLNIHFFIKNKHYLPFIYLSTHYAKLLFGLGYKFFIIQLNYLILYTTDKILISYISGPASVTQYDLIMRIFTIFVIGYSLLTNPTWSLVTTLKNKGNISEIKDLIKKQEIILLVFLFAIFCSSVAIQKIIFLWTGSDLLTPLPLVATISIVSCLNVVNMFYTSIANGLGLLNKQAQLSIISMLLNIPLSLILGKYLNLGSLGVIFSTLICLIPFVIFIPKQIYSFLNPKL